MSFQIALLPSIVAHRLNLRINPPSSPSCLHTLHVRRAHCAIVSRPDGIGWNGNSGRNVLIDERIPFDYSPSFTCLLPLACSLYACSLYACSLMPDRRMSARGTHARHMPARRTSARGTPARRTPAHCTPARRISARRSPARCT
ncbi:hypothetical protein BC938DRAFT_475869 [Jimgerdemannia flammicorona]|uniref:Uncharacterized protein n=1 Tax=Jimgerdemannia flammicorona TaxID=994334 RepID=A0A433QRA0_9FUNG|nr:hypothetical protein BC938DRAFT_475869 [Jimgerdemannia flammicorona]